MGLAPLDAIDSGLSEADIGRLHPGVGEGRSAEGVRTSSGGSIMSADHTRLWDNANWGLFYAASLRSYPAEVRAPEDEADVTIRRVRVQWRHQLLMRDHAICV